MRLDQDKIDKRLESVVANVIGFELYNDGRPVKRTSDGVPLIVVSDDEAARCRHIAKKVMRNINDFLDGHEVFTMSKEDVVTCGDCGQQGHNKVHYDKT